MKGTLAQKGESALESARPRPEEVMRSVLTRACEDAHFLARLAQDPASALAEYGTLGAPERAALASGDVRWLESRLGKLDKRLLTWPTARLAQEKW